MQDDDLKFLKEAYDYLEDPSFVTKVTDFIGKPIEVAFDKLPTKLKTQIGTVSEKAIRGSLNAAYKTLIIKDEEKSLEQIKSNSTINRVLHDAATTAVGAVGGFFGEAGLIVELPLTTTLIMRSILAQGQTYGDLSKEELITNSLYVFSLGSSKSSKDDDMDSAYYTSRLAMDHAIRQAAEYLAANGPKTVMKNIDAGTAPIVLELVTKVAQRFNITVSEKMLVEALPVVGAITGGGINLLFTDFFTLSAKYHFGIKHLEKKYGKEAVQTQYEKIKTIDKKAS